MIGYIEKGPIGYKLYLPFRGNTIYYNNNINNPQVYAYLAEEPKINLRGQNWRNIKDVTHFYTTTKLPKPGSVVKGIRRVINLRGELFEN